MKASNDNIIKKILKWFEKKYKAPEECKLQMAERNLSTMIRIQPLLIALGVYGVLSILIKFRGDYLAALPRFIYFSEYIILGITCILLSIKLKKINFARSTVKMIPTYLLFAYLMGFPIFLLYYEKSTFNSMIVFACIAVNFPVFFDISPLIFGTTVTVLSLALLSKIHNEYNMFIMMDSVIFVFILYFHSLKRWGNEKDNFIHHRSEHEYKENVENEIKLAQVVQQSFFKHNETIYDDWAISYYNKPMAGVSGVITQIPCTLASRITHGCSILIP